MDAVAVGALGEIALAVNSVGHGRVALLAERNVASAHYVLVRVLAGNVHVLALGRRRTISKQVIAIDVERGNASRVGQLRLADSVLVLHFPGARIEVLRGRGSTVLVVVVAVVGG